MTVDQAASTNPGPAARAIVRSVSPLWDALRYSSPLPVRFFLAVSALFWCGLMFTSDRAVADDPVYILMFDLAPRTVWAALFGIDGLLLIWRIFDPRARIGITRLINASTVALWAIYLGITIKAFGCFPPDAGDEIAMLIAATWTTLRTSLTVADRGTA